MNRKGFAPKKALALAAAGLIPLAAAANLAVPATAADFGQPLPEPPPAYDMVDFSSGWYVRGDIAYARETFPEITPDFGLIPSVRNTYSTGAGMGYKINDWLRTDLILDYRSPVQSAGIGAVRGCEIVLPDVVTGLPTPSSQVCAGHFNTQIHRWDLLANAYIDLGTWQGVTPYVGAGAGVSWARIWQSVNWSLINGLPCQASCGFPGFGGTFFFSDWDRSQSVMQYRFAWALMAGFAVALTDHVQLDAGYRYLNLGTVSSVSAVTGAAASRTVTANEVRAGLRYTID
ncbi:MAG: porin family protein [Methylocapsa sp.]|nr:porin family protein [Methylocapsa sp.]